MSVPVPFLVSLLKAVARLALPAAKQLEYLQSLGVAGAVDELALEFADAFQLVPQFVDAGWLSPDDADRLRELDGKLAVMSQETKLSLWSDAALQESADWEDVRRLARNFAAARP